MGAFNIITNEPVLGGQALRSAMTAPSAEYIVKVEHEAWPKALSARGWNILARGGGYEFRKDKKIQAVPPAEFADKATRQLWEYAVANPITGSMYNPVLEERVKAEHARREREHGPDMSKWPPKVRAGPGMAYNLLNLAVKDPAVMEEVLAAEERKKLKRATVVKNDFNFLHPNAGTKGRLLCKDLSVTKPNQAWVRKIRAPRQKQPQSARPWCAAHGHQELTRKVGLPAAHAAWSKAQLRCAAATASLDSTCEDAAARPRCSTPRRYPKAPSRSTSRQLSAPTSPRRPERSGGFWTTRERSSGRERSDAAADATAAGSSHAFWLAGRGPSQRQVAAPPRAKPKQQHGRAVAQPARRPTSASPSIASSPRNARHQRHAALAPQPPPSRPHSAPSTPGSLSGRVFRPRVLNPATGRAM